MTRSKIPRGIQEESKKVSDGLITFLGRGIEMADKNGQELQVIVDLTLLAAYCGPFNWQ